MAKVLTDAEIRALTKKNREYRKSLEHLTMTVRQLVAWLDREMKQTGDVHRGKRIARVTSNLEMINDRIRFLTLGENFRKPKKMLPIPPIRGGTGS